MSIQQIAALIQAGQLLVATGVATIEQVRAWIKVLRPGMSEADLNAILDVIIAGATRHKALADADAGGPPS